ncbi:TBC1 domain family member protein [Actinidia chinensis var. chinensis]|uniref:TBC1 domain family member protein n=1 Tax=Actinidia chinensis var. chinensis TaxID=1590841 RepID=A0A2R6P2K5_ACTCC|nr:TBC1 domain family member protein [Actinidia chinensis var. chinensis]
MLKAKIKLPEKALCALPDRLGNLDAGSDGREQEIGGSDWALESGEELETFQPNGLGLGGSGPEIDEYERDDGKCSENEFEQSKVRPRNERDVGVSVSVKEIIAADERRSDLDYELSLQEINLEKLQRIASLGLLDGGGLRATAWKLLLGYLPASRDLWEKELAENRLKYAKLKEELLLSPSEFSRRNGEVSDTNKHCADSDVDGPLERHTISDEDHPLKIGKASVWHQFFQFKEIGEQIDRDLQRTHPDMKFFSGESSPSRKNREAMRNILLLFAKLNPEIRYVQGMNEVLAPIYYIFSTDTNEQNAANAEADSFSCFVRLLSDSVDHFCQQLDNSSVGIHSTLSRLSELLKANDEELWRHLEFTTKVNPQFYAFRWITLLLTQEFDFQPVLRIWDTLLSNPFGVQEMLLRVCCAMLLCVKSRLLSGDFIANLKLLQHYPEINIEHLLRVAKDIIPDTTSFHLPL